MTVLPIRILGEPTLHSPTRPVTAFDSSLRELVANMFETMYAGVGVGLAANQIGDNRRVFVYDCLDAEGAWHVGTIANPVLYTSALPQRAPDPDRDMEGCLSVPLDEGYPVVRAEWAMVTGSDLSGNPVKVYGSGVLARCFQHEVDHLAGHLYLERLSSKYATMARDLVAARGWGAPGHSWLPKEPDEESSPVDRTLALRADQRRGPISTRPAQIPAGIPLEPYA